MAKARTCTCWHAYCCAPPKGKKGRHCGMAEERGCYVRAGKRVRKSRFLSPREGEIRD